MTNSPSRRMGRGVHQPHAAGIIKVVPHRHGTQHGIDNGDDRHAVAQHIVVGLRGFQRRPEVKTAVQQVHQHGQREQRPAEGGQSPQRPVPAQIFFRKRVPLKHDVFDRIVCTSQFIDKDFLQRQGHGVRQQRPEAMSRSVASWAFIRMMRVCTWPILDAWSTGRSAGTSLTPSGEHHLHFHHVVPGSWASVSVPAAHGCIL